MRGVDTWPSHHRPRRGPPAADRRRRTRRSHARKAVQWWAYIGAAFVIFWAYVLIRWVTGPYFHHVASGPDSPPLYMKIAMDSWQIASVPIVGFLLWRLLIRPWRRDGVVSFDGLVIPAALVIALQDPLSDYTGQVYNYNAYLVNMGSYVNDIPGWRPFGRRERNRVTRSSSTSSPTAAA